jgi:hypothetical protein
LRLAKIKEEKKTTKKEKLVSHFDRILFLLAAQVLLFYFRTTGFYLTFVNISSLLLFF